MGRVHKPNKWLNMPKHSPEFYNMSPTERYKGDEVHPEKASSLSSWLFLKYDMSYKTFSRKSKARKDALRREFEEETGKKSDIPKSNFNGMTDTV